jgi:hypothetical protein
VRRRPRHFMGVTLLPPSLRRSRDLERRVLDPHMAAGRPPMVVVFCHKPSCPPSLAAQVFSRSRGRATGAPPAPSPPTTTIGPGRRCLPREQPGRWARADVTLAADTAPILVHRLPDPASRRPSRSAPSHGRDIRGPALPQGDGRRPAAPPPRGMVARLLAAPPARRPVDPRKRPWDRGTRRHTDRYPSVQGGAASVDDDGGAVGAGSAWARPPSRRRRSSRGDRRRTRCDRAWVPAVSRRALRPPGVERGAPSDDALTRGAHPGGGWAGHVRSGVAEVVLAKARSRIRRAAAGEP